MGMNIDIFGSGLCTPSTNTFSKRKRESINLPAEVKSTENCPDTLPLCKHYCYTQKEYFKKADCENTAELHCKVHKRGAFEKPASLFTFYRFKRKTILKFNSRVVFKIGFTQIGFYFSIPLDKFSVFVKKYQWIF